MAIKPMGGAPAGKPVTGPVTKTPASMGVARPTSNLSSAPRMPAAVKPAIAPTRTPMKPAPIRDAVAAKRNIRPAHTKAAKEVARPLVQEARQKLAGQTSQPSFPFQLPIGKVGKKLR